MLWMTHLILYTYIYKIFEIGMSFRKYTILSLKNKHSKNAKKLKYSAKTYSLFDCL